MSGFTLTLPTHSNEGALSRNDFERLAYSATTQIHKKKSPFAAIGLPPLYRIGAKLAEFPLLNNGTPVRPELISAREGRDAHDEVTQYLSRLSPKHAIVINGSTIIDPASIQLFDDFILKLSRSNPSTSRIWAEFNCLDTGNDRLKVLAASGLHGFYSPSPIIRSAIEAAHNRISEQSSRLVVGVPYILNADDLKRWLTKAGIDISQHLELQRSIEAFEKAEQDGHLDSFRRYWNEGQIAATASVPGLEGLNFLPVSGLFDEATHVFNNAVSITTVPVNSDFLKEDLYFKRSFIKSIEALGIKVYLEDIIFSQKKLPGSEDTYAKQSAPLLAVIADLLREFKQAPNSMFESLSLRIIRPTFKTAQPLASLTPIYTNQAGVSERQPAQSYELCINLLSIAKTEPQKAKEAIRKYLQAFIDGKLSPDNLVCLDEQSALEGESKSSLLRLGLEGWAFLNLSAKADYITLKDQAYKGPSKALFPSAEKENFIKLCADVIESSILNCGIESPVFLEPGSYQAHGVKSLLKELAKRANTNPKLKEKLANTTFLFSDFKAEALKTCSDVLGERDSETGIKFEYLELDATQNTWEAYAKYKGRIIGVRAINVFDAFPSDILAIREGESYRILTQTYLNRDKLESILHNELQDHHPDSNQIFNFKELKVSADRLIHILKNQDDEKRVERLLSYLTDDLKISQHRAIYLWKKIYDSCLEQQNTFVPFDNSTNNELKHISRDIISANPGSYNIPDSQAVSNTIKGFLELINPGGTFITIQLATGPRDNRSATNLTRLYSPTPATPVCWDIVQASARHNLIDCQRIAGSEFGLANTNSALLFKKK